MRSLIPLAFSISMDIWRLSLVITSSSGIIVYVSMVVESGRLVINGYMVTDAACDYSTAETVETLTWNRDHRYDNSCNLPRVRTA
jgi:hypothetical protein